jgi:ribosome-associated heat shock protein Hsp15
VNQSAPVEDRDWQRLDKWLWCARVMRARADCARLVVDGRLRINRQPTDKPHARLRVGDVITLPLRDEVRVLEVLALAPRRGPAEEARRLYREILPDASAAAVSAAVQCDPCGEAEETAYRAP